MLLQSNRTPPQEKTCTTFSLLTNKENFFYTFYAKSNYTIHIKQMYEYNETRNNEYSMECFIEIRYIYIYVCIYVHKKKKKHLLHRNVLVCIIISNPNYITTETM